MEYQLSLPNLASEDRKILDNVIGNLFLLEARIDGLEKIVNHHPKILFQRHSQLFLGNDTPVITGFVSQILECPKPVHRLYQRPRIVNDLSKKLKEHTWVAINGTVGIGKTQISILLTKQFSQ